MKRIYNSPAIETISFVSDPLMGGGIGFSVNVDDWEEVEEDLSF